MSEQVFRPVGAQNRFTELGYSKVKYKFIFTRLRRRSARPQWTKINEDEIIFGIALREYFGVISEFSKPKRIARDSRASVKFTNSYLF